MSLKNKILTTAALALAVGAFSTFTAAQTSGGATENGTIQKQERRESRGFGRRGGRGEGMHGDKRRGGKFGMRGLRGLNLTDAQKEQVRTIIETNRSAANQATHEEFRSLKQAKRGGTITAEQQTRLETLKEQMRQNAEATRTQILAILTPEQRTQLEQQKEEMRKRHEERRQQRRENRQAPISSTKEG